MKTVREVLASSKSHRPAARRSLLVGSGLALALLLVSAVPVPAAPGGEKEAGRLYLSLDRMAKFASHRVRPPAARLASALPDVTDRLGRLREPASNAEAQVRITLDELQQMSALTYDSHYMAALVAAGRAFVAISGQDPLTRTTINPEYLGLDRELAADAASAEASGRDAGKALRGVRRLNRELIRSKGRAGRLERQLHRLRARATHAGVKPR